jgi:transcriptional regulator with XRE-family HTH domain
MLFNGSICISAADFIPCTKFMLSMTELLDKINEVLKSMNYSFEDLAMHLGMNSQELKKSIEDRKLELRTLEFISKELRIPLYSFFRSEDFSNANIVEEDTFYKNKINQMIVEQLEVENAMMRKEIDLLKKQLQSCENKLRVFL